MGEGANQALANIATFFNLDKDLKFPFENEDVDSEERGVYDDFASFLNLETEEVATEDETDKVGNEDSAASHEGRQRRPSFDTNHKFFKSFTEIIRKV